MSNIPKFLQKFITTPDPEDSYQLVPGKCSLEEIAKGLVAGFVQWDDGTRDSVVFYDVNSWGTVADKLAPRDQDDDITQPQGEFGMYTHHHLDTSHVKSSPQLGWFFTVMDISGKSAYELADKLRKLSASLN